MMWRICETCAHSAWRDGKTAVTEVCLVCTFGTDGQPTNWKEKSMTNADRIRAMSDEELANFLHNVVCKFMSKYCKEYERIKAAKGHANCNGECDKAYLKWLKQPAEEET